MGKDIPTASTRETLGGDFNMTIYCNYHPTKPAVWTCPRCHANLCESCIIVRKVEQYGTKKLFHLCPKCNVQVEKLSVTNVIVPFWKRLHHFFTYPIGLGPLALMTILTLLSFLFVEPSLFDRLVQFALWGVMLKYSYSALASTANGNLRPPPISMKTISDDFEIVFKQISIFLILGYVFSVILSDFGISFGILFLLAAILMLPAMIITLAVTKSLFAAIYPPVFFAIAWRIKGPYLLMYLFLLFLLGAPSALADQLISFVPQPLLLPLIVLAGNYYTLVAYHLMGYVMFQYHEQVGYSIIYEGDAYQTAGNPADGPEESDWLKTVDILIKEGNYEQALALMEHESADSSSDLKTADRYYFLLSMQQEREKLLPYAVKYLDILVKNKQSGKTAEVYLQCHALDENFLPEPATLYGVALALNETGKHQESVSALAEFTKKNVNSPYLQNAMFIMAKIHHEKLSNPKAAQEILTHLVDQYPFHENTAFVKSYLNRLSA